MRLQGSLLAALALEAPVPRTGLLTSKVWASGNGQELPTGPTYISSSSEKSGLATPHVPVVH